MPRWLSGAVGLIGIVAIMVGWGVGVHLWPGPRPKMIVTIYVIAVIIVVLGAALRALLSRNSN